MILKLIWVSLLGLTIATAATPQEVIRLQPDFTFKRVGVPNGSTGSRINVQIDPEAAPLDPIYGEEPAEPQPQPAGLGTSEPVSSSLAWFWETISPSIDGGTPGRASAAIERVVSPPAGERVPAPRLQTMQDIASAHGLEILRETVGTNVSPALVLAVIAVESAGRTNAVSSAGAQGLMQLMPATADRFGVTNSFNPGQNIKGGVAYLNWLLSHFDGDPLMALAGYNAGEGNVAKYSGVPPFAETRDYVPKVLAAWHIAKGVCQTPPQLISDACVFNVNGI